MNRTKLIIALALLLAVPTAAKADPQSLNATAHVISLVFVDGRIDERREQKSFDTIKTCLAWKHQGEFLPPQPGSFVSFTYCELTNVGPTRTASIFQLTQEGQ
ncbi:hypothetical protein NKH16_15980 [Mesorhizobium sp. M1307]|uniref:hypothetical protein n=1 Tax=unclassified Mesorhizobium TaxID=325217 RepID=UPI00333BF7E6